ncbi:protein FAM200A-like [Hydra vulgaris]|uniref:Protein FAM200A-like n=1 Tax=Hydra vulgaris TaxID=6087 RepID=A0ABM4CLW8_HYDVU
MISQILNIKYVVTSTSQATQQEKMLSVSINLEHNKISKDHNESRYKSNADIFANPNNLTTAMQVEETDPEPNIFQYVTSDVLVKEELLKDATRDLKEALDSVLVKGNAPKNKLVSAATDGETAMVGKHVVLIGLLKSDSTYPEFIPVHCVVHRKHLATKHFNFPIIFESVLKSVNYIRSNAKNQFKNFIRELELVDKPSDLSFYYVVRWLLSSGVLYRFVELLEPIKIFLLEKQKTFETI